MEIGNEAAQFPEKEYINWDFPCSVVRFRSVSCLHQVRSPAVVKKGAEIGLNFNSDGQSFFILPLTIVIKEFHPK